MDVSSPLVLVVDDEPPILDLVRGYLTREGFRVEIATTGIEAVDGVRRLSPDVVILDVMLPGIDGVEVCRQIRTFSDAYVLMLTARGEEIDRVVGLSVGADDYLVKPFSPRELVARVKALLRRPRNGAPGFDLAAPGPAVGPRDRSSADAIADVGGLVVDPRRRTVAVDGRGVELTALEFDILAALARDPGFVIRRSALLDAVWGPEYVGDDHLVDVHVANVRRKLGDDPTAPRFIETVRGVGYRLREGA